MKASLSQIKEQIHPVDFYNVELGVIPKSSDIAWYVGGLCPFHSDRKEGSFRANQESGAFTCFSCGAKGGDIVEFTKQRYGLSFAEALRKLTHDWRVQC